MIFEPIHSVVSLDFYRKVAAQSLGRSFLYVCYLGLLFSVAVTLALKVKVGPVLDETFVWLETSMPPLTYADGRITSTQAGPVKLQHPRLKEIAVMIDTSRATPVTPQEMEEAKILAFLAPTTFYLREQNGNLRVYDLSKSASNAKPVSIDAAFYRNAKDVMGKILYPVAFFVTYLFFLVWKSFSSLAYSLAALMINAMANGGLSYAPLLNIAVYAQTLVIALQVVTLFLPFPIPGFPLISVGVTGVYIWLAVKRHSSPSASPLPA